MNMPSLRQIAEATFDAREVVKLLSYARGRPATIMDVANLSRPGKPLDPARVARGVYDRKTTLSVMRALLRVRLATELGRVNQQLLPLDSAYTCPECKGDAVQWEGAWRCEHGHQGQL
jgi:hypothetical protein